MTLRHLLGIRELSLKYGCSLRTLRFYEERGLLTPSRIGQQRLYGKADEIRLQLVLCGKRLGLSLQEIQALILARSEKAALNGADVETVAPILSKPEIVGQITRLAQRRKEIEAAIADLREGLAAAEKRPGTTAA